MKKFLFTLAALFMVGTVCAEEYWYADDFEVPQDKLGKTITLPVKAHFDYAVSAGQVNFTIPEGLTLTRITKGSDFNIMVHDEWGDEWEAEQTVFVGSTEYMNLGWAFADMDYYEVDGEWLEYGSYKFLPGEYENQFTLTLRVAADFTGGDLIIESMPSCTYDNRPDVEICPKDQDIFKTCHITVEGATPPPVTPAPEIVVTPGENSFTFEAVGEGEITLYLDGVPVDNPYTVERTDVDQVIKLTAVAHIDGQEDGSVYGEYIVPALEVLPPVDPSGEIVISDPDENGVVTITYTGEEDDVTITVTVNGEEVVLGEDGTITVGEGESVIVVVVGGEGYNDLTGTKTVTYTVPEPPQPQDLTGEIVVSEPTEDGLVTITYTGDEDVTITVNGEEYNGEEIQLVEGENAFDVVVSAEGYNDLTGTFTVTWTVPEPPQPEPTPAPEITYVVNEDNVVITATGEGTIVMMVDGVEVENPYTIERGATDVVVVVTATAQAEGQLVSDVTTMEITIPAIGEEPQDPHATGVWVVFIAPDGQENWTALLPGEGEPTPYSNTLPLNKGTYGFPVDGVEPLVDFYLVVDGVTYGPEDYEALTEDEQYGNANLHELFEGEGHFAVPSGYWYTVGVITDRDTGIMYLQISKGVFTSIEEMNAGKTVSNVRYFNLAGQEMQEANGVTIIVTSYTDGTTSVAKVMK